MRHHPLRGVPVLVTRAAHQCAETEQAFAALGAEVESIPCIAMGPPTDAAPLAQAVDGLSSYDVALFTSQNGVRQTAAALGARCWPETVAIGAVGPVTAQEVRERWAREPSFQPEVFRGDALAEALLTELGSAPRRLVLFRAQVAREVLPEQLRQAGHHVDVVPTYATRSAVENASALATWLQQHADSPRPERELALVVLASSSAVQGFFELAAASGQTVHADTLRFACIGPLTARSLRERGYATWATGKDFTLEALVEAVVGR